MKLKLTELQDKIPAIIEGSRSMNKNQIAEKYNTCYYNIKKIIEEHTPSLISSYERYGEAF